MPKVSSYDLVTSLSSGDTFYVIKDGNSSQIDYDDMVTLFAGGTDVTLDLGDDGGDDSTALAEIATSGDTNSVFTMPSADKLLIDASQNWPTADAADSALGLRGVALDATVASPSDGDILVYRTAGSDWVLEAKPVGSGGVDTSGTPVANDFARFTDADTIEGRSYAEVRSDLGLVIGTNVQAQADVLDDLATLGTASADGEFLVATGAGAFAWESGATARTSLGLAIGADVQAYDADTLKADTADQLTAGFTEALDDDGTQSSGTYTPDPDTGTLSKAIVNGGAFTLGVPTAASGEAIYMTVLMTNNASAGTVTTSGWTAVGGDDLDTTDGNDFLLSLVIINKGGTTYSALNVQALQ